jgi:hypothetical protein
VRVEAREGGGSRFILEVPGQRIPSRAEP